MLIDDLQNRSQRWVFVILAIFLVGTAAQCAWGGSIFDDDYAPPAFKPHADSTAQSTTQPENTLPHPGPAEISPPPPPVAHAPQNPVDGLIGSRHQLPGKEESAASRKLMKQTFATDLADRSPAGRRALGRKLLEAAQKLTDNAVDLFVVLSGARLAGQESNTLSLCFESAEAMASSFDVDATRMKIDAALHVPIRAKDAPKVTEENVSLSLDLTGELIEDGDLVDASRLLSILSGTASGANAERLQRQLADLTVERAMQTKLTEGKSRLSKAPDDPGANYAVGSLLCFGKEDWTHGLPYLAKGSDSALSRPSR